ncbi:uncharacterized protein [Centruroides vittatus]|uniref:uncharacterized protein n=1 Tax=Centruroides vittatus TaxID=120091 RepID=UPI00350F3052
MVYMKTCCCCFKNTRDGSMACAIFYMVTCMINAYLYVYVLRNKEALHSSAEILNIEEESARKMYIYQLADTVITFLCSIFLAVGVRKDNRCLFLPWICWICFECFGLVAILIFLIYLLAVWGFHPSLVIIFVFLLFGVLFVVYMLLCVLSQYQLLSTRPPSDAYTMPNTTDIYELDDSMGYVTPNYGMHNEASPSRMSVPVTTYQPAPNDKYFPTNVYDKKQNSAVETF